MYAKSLEEQSHSVAQTWNDTIRAVRPAPTEGPLPPFTIFVEGTGEKVVSLRKYEY